MAARDYPERLGTDNQGRAFYAVRVPSLSLATWPDTLELASRGFVCLIVADGETETTQQVGEWARRALEQGLVYACAWGPGCEVVHDVIDWEFLALPDHEQRPAVITTWHSSDTLEEAVEFFMITTQPHEDYLAECSSWLLVEVGRSGADSGARGLISAALASSA